MSKHNFSFVTALLLLLLIAAIVNLVFIYHVFNEEASPQSQGGTSRLGIQTTMLGDATRAPLPSISPAAFAPNWRGDVVLVKSPNGGYDIVVEALANGSENALASTAAEVDIRRPGASSAELSPPLEMVSTGKFAAHVDLPGGGTWEVRVRIHRGLQTMEFADKFDLK